jgi:hypothetical protein
VIVWGPSVAWEGGIQSRRRMRLKIDMVVEDLSLEDMLCFYLLLESRKKIAEDMKKLESKSVCGEYCSRKI